MKKILVSLVLCFSLLLAGCKDKKHSVVAINTCEDEIKMIELSKNELINLLDSNQELLLETYSPYCDHCVNLAELLTKYVTSYKKIIYRINLISYPLEDGTDNQLRDLYPEIFKDSYVPTLQFIKDKKVSYKVSTSIYENYRALSKAMNNHFIDSKITMTTSQNGYKKYVENNKNYIAFVYDTSDQKSTELAAKYIINQSLAKNKTPVLLINYSDFAENFSEIMSFYSSDSIHFASSIKDGNIIKTIDYTNDYGSLLEDLISSF